MKTLEFNKLKYYLDADVQVKMDEESYTLKLSAANVYEVIQNQYKLILHPMSDMVKIIKHKGSMFIPIWELYRIVMTEEGNFVFPENEKSPEVVEFSKTKPELAFYVDKRKSSGWSFLFQNGSFWLYAMENNQPVGDCEKLNNLALLEKLFEWHFDVFGLNDEEK